MPRNYACVFMANPAIRNDLIDLGDDPDFSPPTPTWGMCRPDVRNWVKKGSFLVFIGHYPKTNEYYFKGFFQVGGIVSYKEALEMFPNRNNVIIRKSDTILYNNNVWKDIHIKRMVSKIYGNKIPDLFTKIKCTDTTFVQNPLDKHQFDNWKCQRIFRCKTSQIEKCIKGNACKKELYFYSFRGYIVASDLWFDFGRYMIPWVDVCPRNKLSRELKVYTRKGPKHPPIRMEDSDINELIWNANKVISTKNTQLP